MTPSAELPTHVAPHLVPVRSFDHACRLVIDYLCEVAPMDLWAVTRIADGNQLVLASSRTAYPVCTGDAFRFSESLCSRMVSGEGPRIAPDAAHTPGYTDLAAAAPIAIGAYVGTPIAAPDEELFGTVCGFHPEPQPESAMVNQALLDLLSSLLSAVLAGDLHATAAAREARAGPPRGRRGCADGPAQPPRLGPLPAGRGGAVPAVRRPRVRRGDRPRPP